MENLYSHASFFDQMNHVRRDFFRPPDHANEIDSYFIREDKLDQHPGPGLIEIGCLDEHSVIGDIFGKGHPYGLIKSES